VAKKKSEQFEDALKKLQMIVERLERGDLPLEEAMECFTDGIHLVQLCQEKLDEAERKVQMLLKDQGGNWTVTPFDPSATNSSGD
jgi:exodeoxyribonuclease VII small subunit